MIGRSSLAGLAVALAVLTTGPAAAQETRVLALEGAAGWAAFPDESLIHHTVVGAAARIDLLPRLSIGPEITYMVGPGADRDLFLLGAVTYAFRSSTGRSPSAVPFVVAAAGLFHGRNRFAGQADTYNSGTAVLGGGVRIHVTERVYVAPDVRLAVEDPHIRATVNIGVRLGG